MNLATFTNSRVGRHLMIYTFGTACLALLRQTRTVIEMGFDVLDAKFVPQPQIEAAEIDAQPPATEPAGDLLPDHPHAYVQEVALTGDELVPPPPPPPE